VPLRDVHVHFDCASSHKAVVPLCSAVPSGDFLRVRLLLLWCGANFDIARATVSALCACRIALVAARCEFWHGLLNLLVTLGVLDRSGCGAVLLLAVSLNYIDLLDSGKEIFWVLWKVLLWQSCKISWCRVLEVRNIQEYLHHGLAQVLVRRSCGDPFQILLKMSLHLDLEDVLHWCLHVSSPRMLIAVWGLLPMYLYDLIHILILYSIDTLW